MDISDLREYKAVRDIIFDGKLKIVREEMLSMLYKIYIHQLVKIASAFKADLPNQDKIFHELSTYRRDFQDFQVYATEVNKALDIFQLKELDGDGKMKKLKELLKKTPSNIFLMADECIELSEYAYEVLIGFLERENIGIVKEFLFGISAPAIKIVKGSKCKE